MEWKTKFCCWEHRVLFYCHIIPYAHTEYHLQCVYFEKWEKAVSTSSIFIHFDTQLSQKPLPKEENGHVCCLFRPACALTHSKLFSIRRRATWKRCFHCCFPSESGIELCGNQTKYKYTPAVCKRNFARVHSILSSPLCPGCFFFLFELLFTHVALL